MDDLYSNISTDIEVKSGGWANIEPTKTSGEDISAPVHNKNDINNASSNKSILKTNSNSFNLKPISLNIKQKAKLKPNNNIMFRPRNNLINKTNTIVTSNPSCSVISSTTNKDIDIEQCNAIENPEKSVVNNLMKNSVPTADTMSSSNSVDSMNVMPTKECSSTDAVQKRVEENQHAALSLINDTPLIIPLGSFEDHASLINNNHTSDDDASNLGKDGLSDTSVMLHKLFEHLNKDFYAPYIPRQPNDYVQYRTFKHDCDVAMRLQIENEAFRGEEHICFNMYLY